MSMSSRTGFWAYWRSLLFVKCLCWVTLARMLFSSSPPHRVVAAMQERPSLSSVQQELVPFLVRYQFSSLSLNRELPFLGMLHA
jgi:hypothetical protein